MLLLLMVNATAFADSATFHVGDSPQEDAYASTGLYDTNGFNNSNGWQFFGYSPYTASYYDAYWRWPLTIPRGSTITRAYVRIHSDYSNSGPFNAAFMALVTDNKWETINGFNTINYPNGTALDSISHQGVPVEWNNIADWTSGTWHEGPDITDLVQDRIDDADYDPIDIEDRYFGLVLYHISGSAYRTATQEPDDNALTAELYVEWTPGSDPPPNVDSSIFFIDNADEEDTFASTGPYDTNGFDNPNGWQFFGYSSYTASYYHAYWRWALGIPKGSTVLKALVRIRSDYNNVGELNAAFRALVPDGRWERAEGFGRTNYPTGLALDNIPCQGSAVSWNGIADWTNGAWYEGPDIKDLVQARIDNADYDPQDVQNRYFGLTLHHLSGSGYRTGTQEPDDDSLTAELYVKWALPAEPNECPVADAGSDDAAHVGETVQLDGSMSDDLDGDPLTYTWSLVSTPAGSSAMFSDPTAVMPTFVADRPGEYVAELIVTDGTCDSESDACTVTTVTAAVVEFLCPKGKGFWKKHADAWPVDALELGSEIYDKKELLALLKKPIRGNASLILARQLIAAKLNLANGSDPAPIEGTISSADNLLSTFTGTLPYNVRPFQPAGRDMIEYARELDRYNSGELTTECEP
jgi:hypothetical protein